MNNEMTKEFLTNHYFPCDEDNKKDRKYTIVTTEIVFQDGTINSFDYFEGEAEVDSYNRVQAEIIGKLIFITAKTWADVKIINIKRKRK